MYYGPILHLLNIWENIYDSSSTATDQPSQRTHLCLLLRKQVIYCFMHLCHLLTNIPEAYRRYRSFHFILKIQTVVVTEFVFWILTSNLFVREKDGNRDIVVIFPFTSLCESLFLCAGSYAKIVLHCSLRFGPLELLLWVRVAVPFTVWGTKAQIIILRDGIRALHPTCDVGCMRTLQSE